MFERFTKDARQVVILAQKEARGIGHRQIGTEHLLLGLLAEHDGSGALALREHGAETEALIELVRRLSPAPKGEPEAPNEQAGEGVRPRRHRLLPRLKPGSHIPMSAKAKKSLEQSLRAAVEHQDKTITSGHILLGVLRVPETTAHQVLAEAPIDTAGLRTTADRLIGGPGA